MGTNHAPAFARPIAGALGTMVGAYKASVTRAIHLQRDERAPMWQRNYHDHIIRNQREYDSIRAYVITKPARWTEDAFFSL